MGEETRVEHLIMETEDGRDVVWSGIKSVTADFSNDPVDVEQVTLDSMECSFTATLKFPKFFRCKNRKRYKKLLMSLGVSRNYVECYLQCLEFKRGMRQDFLYSYQWLWDQTRRAVYGF